MTLKQQLKQIDDKYLADKLAMETANKAFHDEMTGKINEIKEIKSLYEEMIPLVNTLKEERNKYNKEY